MKVEKVKELQNVQPGKDHPWILKLTAPHFQGKFSAVFSLKADGVVFGPKIVFRFTVKSSVEVKHDVAFSQVD